MILHRYDKEVNVLDIEFNNVTFWIQVHNIPFQFRTRAVAEKIYGAIGLVDKSTDEGETLGDGFIRVQVKVDISKPLCRGKVISLENGKELWVSFKYERLSNLCYWCGSLTHDDRDYELWLESEGNSGTWKCLARSITGTDVIMAEAVGSKRSARPTGG
ncbi:hypothetical protein SO802_023008 [Lithocarpus litseifolius]|uniref:Zinc knuckle CX2CX4HX4C domain-containing protein n=1 Tax=Lithocarpus litseifolius TaxID=425828 RepID=A0AAW2C4X6_9ROSI